MCCPSSRQLRDVDPTDAAIDVHREVAQVDVVGHAGGFEQLNQRQVQRRDRGSRSASSMRISAITPPRKKSFGS